MSGMLINEPFVAVFPSLVRFLGSIDRAVVLQHMHFCADDDGTITITQSDLSAATGIGERTVRRVVTWLRDEGYVTTERTAKYDATLTYRIDHSKLETATESGPTRANAHVDVANLAGTDVAKVAVSDVAKLADSSSKKGRRTQVQEVSRLTGPMVAPLSHPQRRINETEAQPRREFIAFLRTIYPDVALRQEWHRFVNYNTSKQTTSKSWEALFDNWCSREQQRIDETKLSGGDDLGVPYRQRPSGVTPAQPGDDDYVDPQDLETAARKAAEERSNR